MLEEVANHRAPWEDDPQLTARLLERLCQDNSFKSLLQARDRIVAEKQVPLEHANLVCLMLGLGELSDRLIQLRDLQCELGALVCVGAEVDPHWLETEFLELSASLDARRQLDELRRTANSGTHSVAPEVCEVAS